MRSIDKQEVLRLLKKGIQADIWYDAADHEDEVAWQTIEDVQGAMQRAIALLEKPEEARAFDLQGHGSVQAVSAVKKVMEELTC